MLFEINEEAPLHLALLWLLLGLALASGGVLLAFVNPMLLPVGIIPALLGGFILPHGFVPFFSVALKLLAKVVDRALSFAFNL